MRLGDVLTHQWVTLLFQRKLGQGKWFNWGTGPSAPVWGVTHIPWKIVGMMLVEAQGCSHKCSQEQRCWHVPPSSSGQSLCLFWRNTLSLWLLLTRVWTFDLFHTHCEQRRGLLLWWRKKQQPACKGSELLESSAVKRNLSISKWNKQICSSDRYYLETENRPQTLEDCWLVFHPPEGPPAQNQTCHAFVSSVVCRN